MADSIPRIVITPGEPAGIGPDLVVQLAQWRQQAELVVAADPELLQTRAEDLGLDLQLTLYDPQRAPESQPPARLTVLPVSVPYPVQAGILNPANAPYVLHTLDVAVQGCLRGEFAAMVTGPVQKSVINDAGIPFTGHTEYLASRTGGQPLMLLATPGLRVALVTTHLPLAAVPAAITRASLSRVLEVLHADLITRFGIDNPRILVCGLNPHAGEGGHLGREEIDVIEPVLERYRDQGWQLSGPLPADTAFTPEQLETGDAVLAMYHDQGLPVLKHKGFGQAVNITLGLPIIRTSVDHGTALELAGTRRAKVDSLRYALEVALEMIESSSGQTA